MTRRRSLPQSSNQKPPQSVRLDLDEKSDYRNRWKDQRGLFRLAGRPTILCCQSHILRLHVCEDAALNRHTHTHQHTRVQTKEEEESSSSSCWRSTLTSSQINSSVKRKPDEVITAWVKGQRSNSAPDIVILIVINSHVSIALASKSHSCSWANLLPNPEQLLQSRGSHARFHGNLIRPVSSKCVFSQPACFPSKKCDVSVLVGTRCHGDLITITDSPDQTVCSNLGSVKTVQASRETVRNLENKDKSCTIKVLFRSFFTTINFNKGSLEKVSCLFCT